MNAAPVPWGGPSSEPGGGTPAVDYVSVDPISSTVGSSQVLAYVERLGRRGVPVRLHTFEVDPDGPGAEEVRARLERSGVDWRPRPYGRGGPVGGLGRVLRAAWAVRHSPLAHARSDLAAAAVLLGRARSWLWDVRSLYVDQKVATGVMAAGSPQARILRWVEGRAARRSAAVVTLTEAVVDELDRRYGGVVGPKATVVTTCVDTERFAPAPMGGGPTRVLLAGTLNAYYDVPEMLALVAELRRRRAVEFVVAAPASTDWDDRLRSFGATRTSAASAEMPALVAGSHVGLGVCRDDAGVSLLAAMPTKLGEFLACGRPVVVNAGLVDAARLVEEAGAGLAHRAGGDPADTVDRLEALLADPDTPRRCRDLALAHFDLEDGVGRLVAAYGRAVSSP